jgi:oxygen-independent coproporphyrinogen-3 oxidase
VVTYAATAPAAPPPRTAERIRRYDRPGPRYTSYPTAVEMHESVGEGTYGEHLARAAAEHRRLSPLSLYLHLPFCEERCLYCGCNVVVTHRRELAALYLDHLEREIAEVARRLGPRRVLRQLHWGGGTPTYLAPDEMRRLQAAVLREFELAPDAGVAAEVDPRVTTFEHLAVLRELGFNRLSVGVQDFTPEVQEAVHRVQPYGETKALLDEARRLGFRSLNVDLIYGLPHQTVESFGETLDLVMGLRPERVAVYSYAHMPWIKVQQRRIDAATLPTPEVKLGLIAASVDAFEEAGYLAIGMDHFALPEDEMGRALSDGTLWRNFMGYTVRRTDTTIACGLSAIGDVAGGYFQNERKLVRYQRRVAETGLATERGIVLTAEDALRRRVITSLMCRMGFSFGELEADFGVDPRKALAGSLRALRPLAEDGLVRVGEEGVEVTEEGRLFVRTVAMAFDAYLRGANEEAAAPRFSRTI